jgi:hypothetical protein
LTNRTSVIILAQVKLGVVMQNAKFKYLIKTVYAWVDLVYKISPIILVILFSPLLINIFLFHKLSIGLTDVVGLFEPLKELSNIKRLPSVLPYLALTANFAVFIIIFLCIKRIRSFIKNVFDGNAFCHDNGRHLKFVSILMAIIVIVFHFSKIFLISFFFMEPLVPINKFLVGTAISLSIAFNPYIIIASLIYIIGEIIINGAKIKEENDLTV